MRDFNGYEYGFFHFNSTDIQTGTYPREAVYMGVFGFDSSFSHEISFLKCSIPFSTRKRGKLYIRSILTTVENSKGHSKI